MRNLRRKIAFRRAIILRLHLPSDPGRSARFGIIVNFPLILRKIYAKVIMYRLVSRTAIHPILPDHLSNRRIKIWK